MKLGQGQVWKTGEGFVRIVQLERMSVDYKAMTDLDSGEGTHHHATKKEFCRLIKGADLLPRDESDNRGRDLNLPAI